MKCISNYYVIITCNGDLPCGYGIGYICDLWSIIRVWPGHWFNIKMSSYQYRKSHCGDKTVVRSSYLHNGISYTGKMSSLYWIRALLLSVAFRISMSHWGCSAWVLLTHSGWDKMAAIFQLTFSNGFSWMKMYEFWLKFHRIFFQGVQLTIFISPLSEGSGDVMVLRRSRPPPAARRPPPAMVLTR